MTVENYPETRLYTEKYFQKICQIVSKYRYVVMGSLLAGLLAYMYMFTNKFPNYDDLRAFFAKGTTYASGRWGLRLTSLVLPDISMPWIFGVLSLLFLTAGNCLIVRIFGIKSKVLQFLVGGLIVSFPSQTGTFAYMFTACSYAVSLYLAVLAAYFLCRDRKKIPAALLCMILSLSIYQAYLSVTVCIMILFLIYRIFTEEQNIKHIFFEGIFFVVFLVVSLGCYWIATNVIWKLTGTQMGAYADNALVFSLSTVLEGIKHAYRYFFKIFSSGYGGLLPSALQKALHLLCLSLIGMEYVLFVLQKKDWKRSVLLLFLLAILPLGIHCMFLFVAAHSIHTLLLLSFTAIYLLVAILIEHGQCRCIKLPRIKQAHTLCQDCVVLAMAVILLCNIYTANTAAIKMQLTYENTYAFSVSAATQLQSMPGYTSDSKVAIMGTYEKPEFYQTHFSNITSLMGTSGISPTVYSIKEFFTYYVGLDLQWASEEECEALVQTAEFAQMQSYPDHGCIQQIGDVFVIKFSQ